MMLLCTMPYDTGSASEREKLRASQLKKSRQEEQKTAENDMTYGPTALYRSHFRGSEST